MAETLNKLARLAKMATFGSDSKIAEMLEKLARIATLEKDTIAKVETFERQATAKTLEKLTRL
jgi:hypothetical protein